MKTYLFLKAIHRYAGLGLMVFIAMYFLSGFVLIHLHKFETQPKPAVEKRLGFKVPQGLNLAELGVILQDSFQLNGYREAPRMRDDSTVVFEFYHPGVFQMATVNLKEELLQIHVEKQDLAQSLNAFHRIHGYGGGWVYDVLVVLMDLTSLALVIFVLSGIYLWFKIIRSKTLGVILLTASLVYGLAVVLRFMA